MHKCKSSNLDWIDYDPSTKTLKVKFLSGAEYHYENVTQPAYDAFRDAKSHGSHLAKYIKNAYKHKLQPKKEDKDGSKQD